MKEETKQLISRIIQLRSDLPEYKSGDTENKDLINAYHNTIALLTEQVRTIEELPTHGDALTFIDGAIKEWDSAHVA